MQHLGFDFYYVHKDAYFQIRFNDFNDVMNRSLKFMAAENQP